MRQCGIVDSLKRRSTEGDADTGSHVDITSHVNSLHLLLIAIPFQRLPGQSAQSNTPWFLDLSQMLPGKPLHCPQLTAADNPKGCRNLKHLPSTAHKNQIQSTAQERCPFTKQPHTTSPMPLMALRNSPGQKMAMSILAWGTQPTLSSKIVWPCLKVVLVLWPLPLGTPPSLWPLRLVVSRAKILLVP